MVGGINSFREKFKDYSNCYTIIGGAACDILMTEADTIFRATKDIDMILILEEKGHEFTEKFWFFTDFSGLINQQSKKHLITAHITCD